MFSFCNRIDPGFCTELSVAVLHQDVGLRLPQERIILPYAFSMRCCKSLLLKLLLRGKAAELGEVKAV